jgi:phage-related baseplate assembly protein
MTVPTLEQLYTPFTRDDVLAVQLQVASAVGLPVTAWQDGSVGREYLEIHAQSIANFSETSMPAAAAGLLDYATGNWLTLTAFEQYEVTRISSTFGTTPVVLTNTSVNSYTLAAGDVRLYNVETGKTYTSTTGGTLAPGNVTATTLELTIVADQPGTGSNASVGAISGFVTPIQGVTATNADPLVGTDEETDEALRIRCRESMAKASPNGPADAYNYFAKTATRAADDSAIGVTRTNVVQGNGTNFIYVADSSGPIAAADVTEVDTYIQDNVVPTGFTAVTANATAVTVNVAATIYLRRGTTLTTAELTTAIEERLTTYFALAPIGGYQAGGGFIFTSAIIGQIFEASSEIVRVVLTDPAADVALDEDEVAVLGAVTVTIAP